MLIIKGRFYIYLFFLIILSSNIIGYYKLYVNQNNTASPHTFEFHEIQAITDVAKEDICYVFIYDNGSKVSKEMERNIALFLKDKSLHFYKLNVNNCPWLINDEDFNIFSIDDCLPYLLILNKGKIIKQVVGLVSATSLEYIHKQID